ncbi:cellulase-like Ig domain-containing protein [Litorimonas taeanensis]|uniref:Cellulase-like Ig domain-containing protein n=1 Tax=Litorimonas taeanensis TaxID=568099 RepID=A0A420WLI0_9PROT|nr:glycoside hydrolase family 9 protein [Litorimonas taeanensis]RKQ71735.1 cellulase-like Ig domain-containing protein [Litorimonas taeanensis]
MYRVLYIVFLIMVLVLSGCSTPQAFAETPPPILVDQFGYLPDLEKKAIIKDPKIGFDAANSFTPGARYAVINTRTKRVVFEGQPRLWNKGATDKGSGDKVWWFDFSPVTQPGSYVVRDLEKGVQSYPFEISNTVYAPVLKAAFKTFFLQRAGFEKRAKYASAAYADKASHLGKGQDTQARLYNRKDDPRTVRDLRGGWFDAGDYNKYTNWTAEYITVLLSTYVENPVIWTDDFGIPESGNGVPDILDEVKWGLDWLERMQNENGSVLSIMALDSASPPSMAKGASFYGPENTSATIASAGAFAFAAKVFNNHAKYRADSSRYADRAIRAWKWAEENPRVQFFNNDPNYGTEGLAAGQQEVGPERLANKSIIAAIHLYALTQDEYFHKVVEGLYNKIDPMDAGTLNGFEGQMVFDLLYFARLPGVNRGFSSKIKRDYDRNILQGYNGWPAIDNREDAYGAFVDGYWWGSNNIKARRGSLYTQAVLSGVGQRSARDNLNAALGYVHYLHGVNPLGKTYLSNMSALGAENSVNSFYHAWFSEGSKFDDVRTSQYGPAPGFLVGGPNAGYERAACCQSGTCGGYGKAMCELPVARPPVGQPGAKSYADFNEGWPINSWSVTENSNGYQVSYLRLLSKFVR